MWAAGAREKGAAVAATGTQLRAFVRADPAQCAWQLRCPQDLAVGPERQSVQAPHWGGHNSTLLQVWMGSFSWTEAISPDPRGTEGTIHSGSDLHWCGKWDVRCVRPARFGASYTQRASGATSSGFLSGSLGLSSHC